MPVSAEPQSAPAPAPRRRRADAALAALVVGFAFLAASFAARNSDVWLHLAAGRLLARGQYAFGVDPFAYTTAGVYWADHAWLSDLLLYAGYAAVGGGGLVALKAAGVAGLAAVMLRTARGPGPFWVAAACVLTAVLAMSPRLLLQPACLSLGLLAVCVELLRTGGRAHRAVPVVVAAWANLDGWFVLGPLAVALVALGRRLNPADPTVPPLPRWLLPACLAACLATPHHVRGLAPPAELSPAVWASGLPDDPRLAGVFDHPWHPGLYGPAGGYSPAAWAYPVLLAAGLGAFAVNRRAACGWRGLTWLAFAALGAWQARLVPFFAVIAGPVTALTVREVLRPDAAGRAGRAATAAAAAGLCVLAWPGWLQGLSARDRAAGWAVHADPSLRRAAEDLARWRKESALGPAARTFETHPDAAHYLAWFCPDGRAFLDSRLQLFAGVAADYRRLSEAVGVLPGGADAGPLLREYGITAVVLADPDGRRLADGLRRVSRSPDRWEVLRVDGSAVVVAAKPNPPAVPPFDPDRAAFGPSDDGPTPPGDGPPRLPESPPWWDVLSRRPRPDSWEAAAAGTYLRLFEAPAPVPAPGASRSPALPLLAVRAARAAVARDPDDAAGWLALGRAYLDLGRLTWEADHPPTLALLGPLRHIQTASALHQAVTLDPDSVPARELLAGLFTERQYLDLALHHRAAQLRLVRRAGPGPGEAPAAFADRLAALAAEADRLEEVVRDGEARFAVRTHAAAGDPLGRAKVALQLGLVARSQDVLLRSHPDLYGPEGVALLLRILVQTGQAEEARVLLDRDELVRGAGALGLYELPGGARDGRPWSYRLPARDWYDLCAAAGAGRYDRAAAALDRLRDRLRREEGQFVPAVGVAVARQAAFEAGLAAPPAPPPGRLHAAHEGNRLAALLVDGRFLAVQRADLHAVGGLLLAERGLPAAAAAEFARAGDLYAAAEGWRPGLTGRELVVQYRDALRRQAR